MNCHAPRTLVFALFLPFLMASTNASAKEWEPNYDETQVPRYLLPDPLLLADGSRVTTAAQWQDQRRAEVLELFKQHVYGAMPPARPRIGTIHSRLERNALGGLAMRLEVTLCLQYPPEHGPNIRALIYLPRNASKDNPCPAFVGYNFGGNHTVHADPGIHLSTVWDRRKGSQPKLADASTRGSKASRWAIEKIVSRGYALITVYYGDVDPDFYDGFQNGVHALYPEYQNRGDNWTSIGAWAWGLSCVLDYLEDGNAMIDASRVAVIGHSRLGKTSLWTGATDERFALVISNNSGCGGAALARRRCGETVQRINTSFPHWFCTQHKVYNENEHALPVDQHMLIALIAPRPIYIASAESDRWADPRGEFLSAVGADPVYKLLGTAGLPSHEWPAVNTPVVGRIGYHVRTGKHDVTDYDWEQYLAFADKHLGR